MKVQRILTRGQYPLLQEFPQNFLQFECVPAFVIRGEALYVQLDRVEMRLGVVAKGLEDKWPEFRLIHFLIRLSPVCENSDFSPAGSCKHGTKIEAPGTNRVSG